ncbi:hypothetical protein [Halorientalis halophila]|uniref:hypothetical protein n=1 Tax=Halorientalis halophila TaxID=3108499 RepID=UPI00300BB107
MTDANATDDERRTASQSIDPTDEEWTIADQLQWGAMVILILAALVAAAQFYLSATRAIGIWVEAGYEPLFMAAFNLAILLLAVAGVSTLARRLGPTAA